MRVIRGKLTPVIARNLLLLNRLLIYIYFYELTSTMISEGNLGKLTPVIARNQLLLNRLLIYIYFYELTSTMISEGN